jgi:hypothetical protein
VYRLLAISRRRNGAGRYRGFVREISVIEPQQAEPNPNLTLISHSSSLMSASDATVAYALMHALMHAVLALTAIRRFSEENASR